MQYFLIFLSFSHFLFKLQEPILFSTTIGQNIAYGANDPESVTSEELVAAARTANALGFIQAFPDKFDTVVGERGLMLSGMLGQCYYTNI